MQSILSQRLWIFALAVFSVLAFTPLSPLHAITAATVSDKYYYTFNDPGTLNETGSMAEASSRYWWLNSGGKLVIKDGVGTTPHGTLATCDQMRTLYNANSPVDTDNGTHPQNLFRLVSRSQWGNAYIESMFRIDGDNFSASPNRNGSNGLLLMQRYKSDGKTLYYAGVRVDGSAVIKKKINGVYYTMAQKQQVFPGTYVEHGTSNLLPHDKWFVVGADSLTNANGSVTVRLYLKKPGATTTTKILEAVDNGQYGGTAPITGPGYIGIRTDFMDVAFDTFKAIKL